mmetsp:Transcript_9008/g.11217  ORF Transcript_9008/g.11217 Transcript_9008/m.11217 type:complete len:597 (+) Transcript_9008:377-2167(+)
MRDENDIDMVELSVPEFQKHLRSRYKKLLLPFGIILCTGFGVGYQSIGILQWFLPILLLRFAKNERGQQLFSGDNSEREAQERNGENNDYTSCTNSWWCLLLCLSLGKWFAFAGSFNEQENWEVSRVFLVLAASIIISMLTLAAFATSILYWRRYPESLHASILSFPISWVSVWEVWITFSPTGSYGHPSYSQYEIPSIVKFASIFGISGILFLIGWFGALVHYGIMIVETQFTRFRQERDSTSTRCRSLHLEFPGPFITHVRVFCCIFLAVLVYGGASSQVLNNTFYQKGINVLQPEYITGTCISGNGGWFERPLNISVELATSGVDLIVWSENTAQSYGPDQEADLHARAADISRNNNVMLGISYIQHMYNNDHETQETKFVFFDQDGFKQIDYEKVKLVPFRDQEKNMIAGDQHQPLVADIKGIGRLSAALCFDFDFPSFIRKASVKGVDLFLQPAWTWGSIAQFHAMANAFRAVENGFELFRCTSSGVSGLFSPLYKTEAWEITTSDFDQLTVKIPMTRQRWTVYRHFGFIFGWLCVSCWIFLLFLIFPSLNTIVAAAEKIRMPLSTQMFLFGRRILLQEEESFPPDEKNDD